MADCEVVLISFSSHLRLRNVLYNTFCVKMNFSQLNPPAPEENCVSLEPFLVRSEEAEVTEYISTTPPLLSHSTGQALEIKTARKPLVLQPTTIRLNKVRPPLPPPSHLISNICRD